MKYLLAGLGNIGNEYAHTRHNIGFDVIAAFVHKHGGEFRSDRLAYVAEIKIKGRTGICICPTTYMNLSGKALKFWLDKEKIPLERSLTVLDDLALPLTKMRIKPAGSDGGHNGLRSIQALLNTTAYPKFRFGIGSDFPKGMQADFVLGKWSKEEEPLVKLKIEKAVTAIEIFLFQGIEAAMNEINNKEFTL
ncbi:aminoacyl-tRNA hydrolase [Niabella drilacis]|uniref:Peptidyl-tRNA hydrolase n=1 Tax=Niabella drilacis (strain DSM 25811 / CCM 8410 / CCUG 62505 / LMG 26954 / E90) TaxID=1285928 RepID=A0A1G6V399_NIADE|nr:aminoacyl-tRNA hydrolase [Niabella drilacis]SDD47964.1 peptidyl-tRNA hydrolase, PTH1 family [Niabella drilacis]